MSFTTLKDKGIETMTTLKQMQQTKAYKKMKSLPTKKKKISQQIEIEKNQPNFEEKDIKNQIQHN